MDAAVAVSNDQTWNACRERVWVDLLREQVIMMWGLPIGTEATFDQNGPLPQPHGIEIRVPSTNQPAFHVGFRVVRSDYRYRVLFSHKSAFPGIIMVLEGKQEV
jgi:hypothetical protein